MNREIIAYTIDWESKLRKFSGKHKMELPEDLTEMTCWLEIDQGTISGAGVSFWFPIEKAPERCYSIMCTLEGDQAETARIGALVKHLVKAVHKERSHTLFLGFAMDEKKAVNKEALLYNGFKQFDTMHELEAPFPMTYPELQNYKGPHKALFLEYKPNMKTLTRPLVEMYNIAYAGRDLIPYRNSERFIKHFDVEKGAIFMAVEREDSVVGLFELFFNEKTAYVGNLAVAPSHRGTSVADEMCRMGFDAMTDRGFLKMEAHMSDKNLPILRYIERYGLVKTGETERFTLEIKE